MRSVDFSIKCLHLVNIPVQNKLQQVVYRLADDLADFDLVAFAKTLQLV